MSSLLSALCGDFGEQVVSPSTQNTPPWVSPLCLCWFFDLAEVASRILPVTLDDDSDIPRSGGAAARVHENAAKARLGEHPDLIDTMKTAMSIMRTPDALVSLALRPKERQDFETDNPAELLPWDEETGPYEVLETLLTLQTKQLSEGQKRLLFAWEALRNGDSLDLEMQAHVSLILRETVPGISPVRSLPSLPWEKTAAAPRVRPTAAHPRAYQGTKYKPPKDKLPASVDLRPYLCDAEGQARILAGFSGSEAWREQETVSGFSLPYQFRRFFWPTLAGEASGALKHFLALYWELALEEKPQLLAAIAQLAKLKPDENTLRWCRLIAQQPEEWRLTVTSLLIVSQAYQVDTNTLPASVGPLLWEVWNGPCPVYRLFWLFRTLAVGLSVDYLAAGFRLADQFQADYPFHRVRRSGDFPERAVLELMDHLRKGEKFYPRLALMVWKHCGELPGLGQVLEEVDWQRYDPEVAHQYLHLFASLIWDELPPERLAAKWDIVRGQVSQIEELIRDVPPEYQAKCLTHLRDFLWYWNTPQALKDNLPVAYALLRRMARAPFKTTCWTAGVTGDFIGHIHGTARERFRLAPEANLLRLEQACRLENNARLIGAGTWSLTRGLPEFSVDCFLGYPAKLFKVAKLLGCLSDEGCNQVIRTFGLSPLMNPGLGQMGLQEADAIIQAHREAGVFNPVPRKLQEHLAGKKPLSVRQIAQYQEQMHRQLSLTRLETLEQSVLRALRSRFAVAPEREAVKHALAVYHLADENRRPLQKFLRGYWGGEQDYLAHHPLTLAWLQQHPSIDVVMWQQGITFEAESQSREMLSLTVEHDPLEALKLGTYVGSCLGLGGIFVCSAVAAVLDINKQVVYARDIKGNVIARQLLALSEQEQLVCFEVYPSSTPPDVKQMFAQYDRLFAEALGLKLYLVDQDEEYTIDNILSHTWWDDCAWDLQIDESPKCETEVTG